jgi:8-oxo-dGTP pyrophosphatase MutT (NUDIX family)
MLSRAADFESAVSTDSTTRARPNAGHARTQAARDHTGALAVQQLLRPAVSPPGGNMKYRRGPDAQYRSGRWTTVADPFGQTDASAQPPGKPMITVKFCNACGHPVRFRVPDGDHQPRHVCDHCGHIQYFNPRVIVGCVPEWEDGRILMCRRDIEPRRGLWTFPAGFMELAETTAQGAARETVEESQADVEVGALFAVITVAYVSQIYMIHRGRLRTPHHGVTPESSETRLMHESEIPWDEIAFPTVWHSLKFFFADRASGQHGVHTLELMRKPARERDREVSTGEPLPPA